MIKKYTSTIVFLVCAGVVIGVLAVIFQGQPKVDTAVNADNPGLTPVTVIIATTTPSTITIKPPVTTPVVKPVPKPAPTPTPTPSPAPTPAPGTYTMAQVSQHSSGSSCWTVVDNTVYDVTPFINQHPGGSGAIISLCGIDGSSAFTEQHGGQRRPARELAGFEIGVLAQ